MKSSTVSGSFNIMSAIFKSFWFLNALRVLGFFLDVIDLHSMSHSSD